MFSQFCNFRAKENQNWISIEPKTGFFIKTATDLGNSVRLSGEQGRKLAKTLVMMADKTDEMRI